MKSRQIIGWVGISIGILLVIASLFCFVFGEFQAQPLHTQMINTGGILLPFGIASIFVGSITSLD